MSQDNAAKEAELRAQFPYHGETLDCIAITAIPRGLMLEFAFTVDTRPLSGERKTFNAKLDTMVIKGYVETIDLFIEAGLSVDKKDRYLNCDLQRRPIAVVLRHDEERNAYRISAVSYAGKTVSLADLPKKEQRKAPEIPVMHNGKLVRPSEIAPSEAPKQENVVSAYILPNSTSAKLAQLVALAESVLKDMPDYAIAAQIVQHARILQGLELSGKAEQLAEIPKKKRR